ncbi:MAG: hypothetical protein H0V17_22290 [Deltaproteobacteria bacterium]|nr:hypothetical protein [Deltaproteobacteria bacterium]
MLLSAILETILFYGGLALAGFALIIFSVMRDEKQVKEASAGNLPEATIKGKSKDGPWPWLRWVLLVGGLGLTYMMYAHTTDVVLLTGDDEVTATRKVRLFGSDDYKLTKEQSSWGNPTWVVNQSSHPARVETVHYGRNLGFGSEPVIIPPGTAASFSAIEHIGGDDRPPGQVRDTVKLGMDSRHWLKW